MKSAALAVRGSWLPERHRARDLEPEIVRGSRLSGCGLVGRRRLGDLARAQAARADADLLLDALEDRAHLAEVRVEPAVGHVVGVAHPVAELGTLAADVASLSHHSLLRAGVISAGPTRPGGPEGPRTKLQLYQREAGCQAFGPGRSGML